MTLLQQIQKLEKIANKAHGRNCMVDDEDCSTCQFLDKNTIVEDVSEIHRIASASTNDTQRNDIESIQILCAGKE